MKIRVIRLPLPPPDPSDGIEVGRMFDVVSVFGSGMQFPGYWVFGDSGRAVMLYPQDVEIIDE